MLRHPIMMPPPRGPKASTNARGGSGSGGGTVEAIASLLSIAWMPPGHDPGASHDMATAVLQLWILAIGHFGTVSDLKVAASRALLRVNGRRQRE